MPQNVDEMCAENKTSMNRRQNVDEMSARDKTSMIRPQNVEEMSAENKTSMDNASNPGEPLLQQQKSPRSNSGGLISECYDVFYEYLHANDNQDYTTPDFGFLAGLVAELAAALQTNIGCDGCSNKCVECGEADMHHIYIQHCK